MVAAKAGKIDVVELLRDKYNQEEPTQDQLDAMVCRDSLVKKNFILIHARWLTPYFVSLFQDAASDSKLSGRSLSASCGYISYYTIDQSTYSLPYSCIHLEKDPSLSC